MPRKTKIARRDIAAVNEPQRKRTSRPNLNDAKIRIGQTETDPPAAVPDWRAAAERRGREAFEAAVEEPTPEPLSWLWRKI